MHILIQGDIGRGLLFGVKTHVFGDCTNRVQVVNPYGIRQMQPSYTVFVGFFLNMIYPNNLKFDEIAYVIVQSLYPTSNMEMFVCLMVLNATFNNISVISWRSVLSVEETEGPGENHRPIACH